MFRLFKSCQFLLLPKRPQISSIICSNFTKPEVCIIIFGCFHKGIGCMFNLVISLPYFLVVEVYRMVRPFQMGHWSSLLLDCFPPSIVQV